MALQVYTRNGQQRLSADSREQVELVFDGWYLVGYIPPPDDTTAAVLLDHEARIDALEGNGLQPTFAVRAVDQHVLATFPPNGTVYDLSVVGTGGGGGTGSGDINGGTPESVGVGAISGGTP